MQNPHYESATRSILRPLLFMLINDDPLSCRSRDIEENADNKIK